MIKLPTEIDSRAGFPLHNEPQVALVATRTWSQFDIRLGSPQGEAIVEVQASGRIVFWKARAIAAGIDICIY